LENKIRIQRAIARSRIEEDRQYAVFENSKEAKETIERQVAANEFTDLYYLNEKRPFDENHPDFCETCNGYCEDEFNGE
jgi:hypothetical protein